MNAARALTNAPRIGAVGLQPYESRNIRLSAALCAFGFALRIHAEPATVVIDFETTRPRVTFWHDLILPEESPVKTHLPALTADHLGLWWSDPAKYSVDGYDDALRAMRRVLEMREWLIGVVKGRHCASPARATDGRYLAGSVATDSLHIASAIKACGIPLVAFHQRRFVFGPQAAAIATLIADVENGAGSRAQNQRVAANISCRDGSSAPAEPDLCVDWMMAALKYRDWLHRIVRQPDCVPLIEQRDGGRCLRISSNMPKTLRREFTRRF